MIRNLIFKDLFEKIEGKDVLIQSKPYGSTDMIEYRGKITSYYYCQEDTLFFELDSGEFINGKFVTSIKVNS